MTRPHPPTQKADPKVGLPKSCLQQLSGAEGIRTPDPLHAMQVRYQLRHSPVILRSRAPKSERYRSPERAPISNCPTTRGVSA
jgi:hypothetical protein